MPKYKGSAEEEEAYTWYLLHFVNTQVTMPFDPPEGYHVENCPSWNATLRLLKVWCRCVGSGGSAEMESTGGSGATEPPLVQVCKTDVEQITCSISYNDIISLCVCFITWLATRPGGEKNAMPPRLYWKSHSSSWLWTRRGDWRTFYICFLLCFHFAAPFCNHAFTGEILSPSHHLCKDKAG